MRVQQRVGARTKSTHTEGCQRTSACNISKCLYALGLQLPLGEIAAHEGRRDGQQATLLGLSVVSVTQWERWAAMAPGDEEGLVG